MWWLREPDPTWTTDYTAKVLGLALEKHYMCMCIFAQNLSRVGNGGEGIAV